MLRDARELAIVNELVSAAVLVVRTIVSSLVIVAEASFLEDVVDVPESVASLTGATVLLRRWPDSQTTLDVLLFIGSCVVDVMVVIAGSTFEDEIATTLPKQGQIRLVLPIPLPEHLFSRCCSPFQ